MYRGRFGRMDRSFVVDRLSHNIEKSAQHFITDRYGNRRTGIQCLHAPCQSVCRRERHTAYHIIADMLCHFCHDILLPMRDLDRIQQLRQVPLLKFNVDDRAYNLIYHTLTHMFTSCFCLSLFGRPLFLCFCARNNLDQLVRDLRLPHAVIGQRQAA